MSKNPAFIAHLAMILFAALVAGSFSFGALAAPHIGPSALNALRFLLGCCVMAGVAAALRTPLKLPAAPWRFALLGALMAVFFITMFVALKLTDPVSTGAVFTTMPVMSTLFGRLLLGQRITPRVGLSLALAFAGAVWVVFGGDLAAIRAFDLGPGETIFLLGCAGHALYAPMVRKLNRGEPTILFTFWTLVATLVLIATWGAGEIAATDWLALPPVVYAAVAYLAVFTTAGTFFLVQFAALRLPASKVLSYTYATPVIIIALEGLLGHGWAKPPILAGAAVIVAALAVLAFSSDRATANTR
ncbi:MAG TPA: DMT family transporter [Rhizobiaceae bacterium]|nr:DMT family transporter [Rhizobiaceae bacterium]